MDATREAYQALAAKEEMYRHIVEYSQETVIIHAEHKVLYINEPGAKFLRAPREDILGASILAVFQKEDQAAVRERIRRGIEENVAGELIEKTIIRLDGTPVDVELNCHPFTFGKRKAIQTVIRDITVRKEAERRHQEVLREINELSAPVVPLLEGIAILPLVGSIDSERAKQLLNNLPSKIQEEKVNSLIIDLSGIYTLDGMVINSLFQMIDVLNLLGTRSIISGMRPDLAQIAVQLGVDLSSLQTIASVQQALHSLGVRR
ncbi:PAS domain S-box protein [Halalkalibacterium ligniniphilum]|uniref:PAS domain S-box protein n=1 Tax=Halalkalibacterium ligniniphilum TaxID=1134413 RepID=UPI0003482414|nr:PAS domain S-box protein [Halalkalibacterium ligniniphilum]